ncbi:hypothetical protein MNBD_ALPHA03-426 [hydrothermal vent metagenome]|uniref:Uncharacterized protein n=1 Tax=hydrothermal vent metagenome TaxID=652676 RepID=A0A3B1BI32_9ZZZZ
MIGFTLSFEGNNADDHELDLYDAAQAMIGFQRSLAITTHLVLNGNVITQAPSLKNARIIGMPPEKGSWEVWAVIIPAIAAIVYKLGTAPKDTPLGNLMYSAYDYVVSETLGFHVDYDTTLGQQYDKLNNSKQNSLPILKQPQFDSAIEKCENAIKEMHRPIVKSNTADTARIIYQTKNFEKPFKNPLDIKTYDHIVFSEEDKNSVEIVGCVSSYNINTYKGRIFVESERRPIPFELAESTRTVRAISEITKSLSSNAVERFTQEANITFEAFVHRSKTDRVKKYYIVGVK